MKREAVFCSVLVVLLLVSVFHMAYLQLPVVKGAGSDQRIDMVQPRTIEHRITGSELQLLESRIGVKEESQNYNQIVYDHGTGLAPPSEADWEKIGKEAYVVDQVPSTTSLPSNVDNSATPWFPPIGNQGSQGSCVAWAVGYYTKTFQEAKEHNWSLSGTTPNEIMSPSFIYNLINYGVDAGSSYYDAVQLACSVGDCSLAKMPYNAADFTSWPSEQAWTEAPLYRGDSSGFSYMILQNDSDLANVKSWLASGNLAIVSVDAYKIADPTWGWSLLDSNDMLTLDNYVNPSPNHAGTIVGYNDNFAYTEQGQTHYGAFKIANSWGIPLLPSPFGWEHILDGCYWISYEAMKQRVGNCMFYRDRTGYVPALTASFRIAHSMRGECSIVIGMGTHDYPTVSKSFTDYIHGGNQPFCSNNIVFDISEFEDAVPNVYGKPFFLSVYDAGSSATGTILYFSVGNTVSSNPPVNTVNGDYVFADLTLEASSMWIQPSALNFNTGTTSVGFKFNVTVAMNFTENVFAWQAVLYYNATQLNCTRVGATAAPTSDFMSGHSTTFMKAISPGSYPPINGSLKSVIAAEVCSSPDFVAGPHSGTLFWAEFQILLAPSAGQTLSSQFDISTEYALTDTYVWDPTGTPINFTPCDGKYQFTCAPATVYIMSDGSVVPSFAPISSSDNVTYSFTGNVSYPTYEGIVVERSNIMIDGNGYTVQGNQSGDTGLSLTGVSNVTIQNTNIKNFTYGIWLGDSSNNSISGNTITDNGAYGIELRYSSDSTVCGNNIAHNGVIYSSDGVGVDIYWSEGSIISGNNIANNYLAGIRLEVSDAGIFDNNISGNGRTGIASVGCTSTISGNDIANNGHEGIYLGRETEAGYKRGSVSVVLGNNITSNDVGIGGDLFYDSTIAGNNVSGNNQGILVYGGQNNISRNIIARNMNGVCLNFTLGFYYDDVIYPDYNTIVENDIRENSQYGIKLGNASSNLICHNNFQNNTAEVYTQYSNNTWDDGYPSGGNHWSDYTDVDSFKGPNQNVLGSDGIWDHPYVIDANNTDHYPFVNPWVPMEGLVVRGMDSRIYYRIWNGADWGGWSVLPGATIDSPAAAMLGNQLYVVVRGSDGHSLWYGYLTNVTDPGSFSGWTLLSGATSSAPTLTSNGTGLCLVVRGLDNRIYYRFYTLATQTWAGWSVLPSGTTLDSPAASLVGNVLHIVVRGTGGSTLWYSNVDQTTLAFSGWTLLSGSTPSTPTLSSNGTTSALVVRGGDNRIYYRFYTIAAQAWTDWTALPSGTTQDSPAATILENTLCIVVRGSGGSSLWQSSINLDTSTFSGWTLLSGAASSAPTLTS